MRRKGVVFSKMFVLRSMGNELVPSPLQDAKIRFTDVLHPYSSLPIHVRYLYLFATCTLSLPVIFAPRHNISHPDSGKDIGIIFKLNGRDMIH